MGRMEADVALEYGQKNYSKYLALQSSEPYIDCVFRFNRYFPCYLVDPYADTAEFIAKYAASPNLVSRLRRADEENGTNDFGLLKIYLYFDCSVKKTAELLNMHRNTVVYRLNKIETDTESTWTIATHVSSFTTFSESWINGHRITESQAACPRISLYRDGCRPAICRDGVRPPDSRAHCTCRECRTKAHQAAGRSRGRQAAPQQEPPLFRSDRASRACRTPCRRLAWDEAAGTSRKRDCSSYSPWQDSFPATQVGPHKRNGRQAL